MENFGQNFSFKYRNEENAFGAATAIFFSPKNKIKYKHADYLYTYLHWKSTTKESNANHNDVHCFVRLSNFLSQLCTFSYLYLLEKKCTGRKNCCLVLCSMSKTIFLLCSVKTIEGSKTRTAITFLISAKDQGGRIVLTVIVSTHSQCHGLASETFAIDVIGNQTSAKIIFWPLWQI